MNAVTNWRVVKVTAFLMLTDFFIKVFWPFHSSTSLNISSEIIYTFSDEGVR